MRPGGQRLQSQPKRPSNTIYRAHPPSIKQEPTRRRRNLYDKTNVWALFSILLVLIFSLLIVRVATVALTLTGMSQQLARFQARSAFTGAGFTTAESERAVNHPVRRRIIMLLMLLGNAGIVTAVASLMLSVMTADDAPDAWYDKLWVRITIIILMVIAIWTIAQSQRFEQWLGRVIRWALQRWTDLEIRDYAALLHLAGDYHVTEILIGEDDWLAGKQLQQINLSSEGVLVLGVERDDGSYIGAPRGKTTIHPGDTLLIYGRQARVAELDQRPAGAEGSRKHIDAIVDQHQQEKPDPDD